MMVGLLCCVFLSTSYTEKHTKGIGVERDIGYVPQLGTSKEDETDLIRKYPKDIHVPEEEINQMVIINTWDSYIFPQLYCPEPQ